MKKRNTSERVGIIEAVKTPLGFFTLSCLVVEVSLGALTLRLSGTSQLVALWGMIGTLILLIVVVALIATFRPQSLGLPRDSVARTEIERYCGAWWELIPNDPNIALCYFEITSGTSSEPHLEATAYDREAFMLGKWRSQGACLNYATRELFYFWVGDEMKPEVITKDFSGVGHISFSPSADPRPFERGTGWFTFGNIQELRIEGKRKVHVRRVTESESRKITDEESKAKVALSVYREWAKSLVKETGPESRLGDNAA